MKKIYFLITILMFFKTVHSQPGNSPYPVILVHGINSSDETWNTLISYLQNSWITGTDNRFHAILNARGGDTTSYLEDVIIPVMDVNGVTVNQLSNSNLYAINFQNFWNRNASDPRVIIHSDNTPGSNQSSGNESAIYKQGFALKKCIEAVLTASQSDKVILLGHSMGGLAIREYLQRTENGIKVWWVDPSDNTNGHKVAKVVTFGTPHLGSNAGLSGLFNIDPNSEAVRDCRYSFTGVPKAPYLFGNSETVIPSAYYNKDVDCNGSQTDSVKGISNLTSFNSDLPLPNNTLYTWITSNYLSLGTDIVVDLNRQWLYESGQPRPLNISDTILTNKRHDLETPDYRTIIRGLDEPDSAGSAYKINLNKTYAGFITLQSSGGNNDLDHYKINVTASGNLDVIISGANSGLTETSILSATGSVLVTKTISGSGDTLSCFVNDGDYLVRVKGLGTQNTNFNSYKFKVQQTLPLPAVITVIPEGFYNTSTNTLSMKDTVRVFLRNILSPFNIIDSAKSAIDSLNFSGTFEFQNAPSGTYYLMLKHRNSIETWSKAGGEPYAVGQALSYDFTISSSQAFGDNLFLSGSKYCIYSGDADQDGFINLSDVLLIYNDANNFITGYEKTDVTGDNISDLNDVLIAYNNSAAFAKKITP